MKIRIGFGRKRNRSWERKTKLPYRRFVGAYAAYAAPNANFYCSCCRN